MRALLAVADATIRALWESLLAEHGHTVIVGPPDLRSWPLAEAQRPELAIVELPADGSGALELCRRLRRPGWEPRPSFMVVLHPDHADQMVDALRTGADDVLVGQAERRAAVAHLSALERRRRPPTETPPTAHELATSRELASRAARREAPSPVEPDVRAVMSALARHLDAARRDARAAARDELDAATAALDTLRRALGMPPGESAEQAPAQAAPEPDPTAPPTILLIDDEAGVRFPLRLALQHCGYRVLEAADGEEGLETIARCGRELALVVVDQRMPRLSGSDVLREVRRRHGHLPVVLMSGQAPADCVEGAGAPDAFLRKPFELADLARTVRRLVQPEVAIGA